MQRRWLFEGGYDYDAVASLQEQIHVSDSLATLLVQRGIKVKSDAEAFFRPQITDLHDPFLMKDMDLAVSRLVQAIDREEKVLIYGDYDVDGTTSVATVYGYLSSLYKGFSYYIPDRYKEGYGVSQAGIEHAEKEGIGLIITLDCGIKAVEQVKLAKDKGIDMIICDHHRPGDLLPQAVAVLDPKRADCYYPYKELSGCGVGFKLLQAFCQSKGHVEEDLFQYLDLVAVSIASDIVPITGENRILAFFGLKKLNQRPRPGLAALVNLCKTTKKQTVSGIVFGIGPRINAAGRMHHAGSAVDLLLAKTAEQAAEMAQSIEHQNDERRHFDLSITEEALEMIADSEQLSSSKSIVLYKNDWHKGVIGIVASRCIDKHYKPTIILTESNNMVTGSARSVDGFDVYEAISECADLLEQYGGHKYAAGVTMQIEQVEAFKSRFEEVVCKKITEEQLIPVIKIDTVIFLDEIDERFYHIVSRMAPFGPKNMQPVFVSENVYATNAKLLKGEHLKFTVNQEGSNRTIEAIGFGLGQYIDLVESGMRFHLAYTVEENEFRGLRSLQLMIKDIKFD
jgi:single-stranded-DNA-specific exonuclease